MMPAKMPDWVDVQIPVAVDSGELLGLLGDPLVQGAWEDQGVTHLYWSRPHWNGEQLGHLCAALDQLDPSGQARAGVRVGDLPHQDWNRQWAQSVKPLRVGRHLVIRPSWEVASLREGDLDIILDPKQAFGTGHHATTRMLLEWLEDLLEGGESVLDVGSGSGILAMAALRLGARSAIGVEIDPVAVDCALECASQNAFGPELKLICGTLSDVTGCAKPDFVVANIDRQTLLSLADELAAYGRAGSRIFFSGVLVEQVDDVMARYAGLGLYLVNRREQEGWVALELGCSESCEGSSESMQHGRPPYPHVHQISVSDGGVPKKPVLEALVTVRGLEGDRQRNLKVHGGPDRAVCLYSLDVIEQLQDEGHSIEPGSSGENLTLAGLDWALMKPGVRLTVGPDVELEVMSYTSPCSHNAQWFHDGDYQRISQKKHPGWSRVYAKVLKGGVVRPGDQVECA